MARSAPGTSTWPSFAEALLDAVVIGTGFGGLGAALTLAEAGADVLVLERLNYPGGCAGSFTRDGATFDAGATVAAGLGEGQLFRQWLDRLGLSVDAEVLSPAVELRTPGSSLVVPSDRDAFARQLASMPGAPAGIEAFFATQGRVADALWPLFADPSLLPPLSASMLARHVGRAGSYLPVLGAFGRTVEAVMRRHGVEGFAPLRLAIDAGLQITVQTSAAEADAAFGLSALDFWFREPTHVKGGMGHLADALVEGIRQLGGRVSFSDRAKGLRRERERWIVSHRRGETAADVVVANLLPEALRDLTEAPLPSLDPLQDEVERSWGAAAWFAVVEGELPAEAFHWQLVADPEAPLIAGNHLLASVSGADERRAGPGQRVMTASTHLPMPATPEDVAAVQAAMRHTLASLAPELRIVHALPASPRTYARFVGRPGGFVGGPPRVPSLANVRGAFPGAVAPGLYLVGDSVFPGQSTLATAVGGHRVATLALRATSGPRTG
ncbi:MAG: FAD-binding protein [Deltaproteobacteria bacterium]|nr:MAG: FAD-binding protein [Deltaproteobacteria bacterium]